MALALDASTPTPVHGASSDGSETTASFTPPANSILVVCGLYNATSFGTLTASVSDSLATHLTYTSVLTKGSPSADNTVIYLWWAKVTTSAAMTVTMNLSLSTPSAAYPYLAVFVFTGANTTTPIGANGGGTGVTGTVSDPYTSTVPGSWGWLLAGEYNGQALTAGTSQTLKDGYSVSGAAAYGVIQQNATTASAGTTVTMSTAAPTSSAKISHLYFEVVPPASVMHNLALLGVGA